MIVDRYKKPIPVRTVQWTGRNLAELVAFTCGGFRLAAPGGYNDPGVNAEVYDRLHDSWIGVKAGHHIVEGVEGENYPIDDVVIGKSYGNLAAPSATEFGIRLGDGTVLVDGAAGDRREQEARLARYRDTWPEAELVRRPVFHGEWSSAEAEVAS